MLLYGSGLRLSEVCNIKVSDIDSISMRVFVDNSKGGKDRYTILSKECLLTLREYWKQYRPKDWLFLNRDKNNHIHYRCVQDLVKKYALKAGLKKHVTVHTMRQCFATHLMETGVDVAHIKTLLGHTHIQSTTFYLHVANIESNIKSPLDTFDKPRKKRGRPSKAKQSEDAAND